MAPVRAGISVFVEVVAAAGDSTRGDTAAEMAVFNSERLSGEIRSPNEPDVVEVEVGA